jgi:RimJ/RimL family protein N-acetyltransferase
LMLKYAFEELGLHKVMANIIVDNKGAVAAFTGCGLTLELTFKDHVQFAFKYHDVGVFAILASEWQARMRGQGR